MYLSQSIWVLVPIQDVKVVRLYRFLTQLVGLNSTSHVYHQRFNSLNKLIPLLTIQNEVEHVVANRPVIWQHQVLKHKLSHVLRTIHLVHLSQQITWCLIQHIWSQCNQRISHHYAIVNELFMQHQRRLKHILRDSVRLKKKLVHKNFDYQKRNHNHVTHLWRRPCDNGYLLFERCQNVF